MAHQFLSFRPGATVICAIATGALSALLAVPASQAEEHGRITLFGHHYSLIAGASVFVPRDAMTRSIYGERSFTPSVALWSFETRRGLGPSWDLGGRHIQRSGRRAQLVQGGIGPRILFADNRQSVAPYLTVRGDVCVLQLDRGDWRVKPGANVELGASVLRHFVISGRYDAIPKVGGFDLSGFTASAAVKLF